MEPHKPNALLMELKRNDRFKFNYETFVVVRKYIDDDKPLIAKNESTEMEQRFYHDELEIERL